MPDNKCSPHLQFHSPVQTATQLFLFACFHSLLASLLGRYSVILASLTSSLSTTFQIVNIWDLLMIFWNHPDGLSHCYSSALWSTHNLSGYLLVWLSYYCCFGGTGLSKTMGSSVATCLHFLQQLLIRLCSMSLHEPTSSRTYTVTTTAPSPVESHSLSLFQASAALCWSFACLFLLSVVQSPLPGWEDTEAMVQTMGDSNTEAICCK